MIEDIEIFSDSRGQLIPIEFNKINFEVKRVFIVKNVPVGTIRGNHSHHETIQYIFCMDGDVDVILHDGLTEKTFNLKKGNAILVPNLIWDSQKFNKKNSEIMVLCSTIFDLSDYIFNFDEFKQIVNKNN